MSKKIAVVVITFNRLDMLKKALAALADQSVRTDKIFVVDNASTDGTAEFLKQLGSQVSHIRLPTNIGAAGGYYEGMKAAYGSGAELIWAMDDDLFPDPDALEHLLDGLKTLAASGIEPAFVQSGIVSITGETLNVPDPDLRPSSNGYPDWNRFAHLGIIKIRRATLLSILFPRSTISEFGLPLAEMFIWGEDTEYTLRVTQTKQAYLVAASRATHANRSIGLNLLAEKSPIRIPYYFYHYRNQLSIARRFSGKRSVLRLLRRFFGEAIHALRSGEFQKTTIIVRGTWAGLWFSTGPSLPPSLSQEIGLS